MNYKRRPAIRFIALLVIQAFLAQEIAFAAPGLKPFSFPLGAPDSAFDLPYSVAFVEDAYKGSSDKTVILIQDAHTNESGQINIAKALELILKGEGMRHVFLEAGTGDVSLSFLRDKASLPLRKEVGMSYVRKGLLQGSEYLDLTSDLDFKLWGVEDQGLYEKAVDAYRAIVEKRSEFQTYLAQVSGSVKTLKEKLYNPDLLAFDRKREAFLKDEMPLTEYFELLGRLAEAARVSLSAFPHLSALREVKKKEEKIDFERAGREQIEAVRLLSSEDQAELIAASREAQNSPFKISHEDDREKRAFFAVLEEKLTRGHPSASEDQHADSRFSAKQRGGPASGGRGNDIKQYPELKKYIEYLKAAQEIDAREALKEQEKLEEAVVGSLARTPDERRLEEVSASVRNLQGLLELTVSPGEFSAYSESPRRFDIVYITGFLNRKIMDLESLYEKTLFLEPGFREALSKAETFYRLTHDRDTAFIRNMFRKMDEENESKAVLITGGYHTPNLKELLRRQNVSYISVTPQVLHPTNHERYERILLSQLLEIDGDSRVARKKINASAAELSASPRPLVSEATVEFQQGTPIPNTLLFQFGSRLSTQAGEAVVRRIEGGPTAGAVAGGGAGGRPIPIMAPRIAEPRAAVKRKLGLLERLNHARLKWALLLSAAWTAAGTPASVVGQAPAQTPAAIKHQELSDIEAGEVGIVRGPDGDGYVFAYRDPTTNQLTYIEPSLGFGAQNTRLNPSWYRKHARSAFTYRDNYKAIFDKIRNPPPGHENSTIIQYLKANGVNTVKFYLHPDGLTDDEMRTLEEDIRKIYDGGKGLRVNLMHFAGLYAGTDKEKFFETRKTAADFVMKNPTAANLAIIENDIRRLARMVKRLGPAVTVVQLSNENAYYVRGAYKNPHFYFGHNIWEQIEMTPAQYYAFMAKLARIYKEEDPLHPVALGHGEMESDEMVDQMIAAGIGRDYDAIYLNIYPMEITEADPMDDATVDELVKRYKQHILRAVRLGIPIGMGEFGKSSAKIGDEKHALVMKKLAVALRKFMRKGDLPKEQRVLLAEIVHELFANDWKDGDALTAGHSKMAAMTRVGIDDHSPRREFFKAISEVFVPAAESFRADTTVQPIDQPPAPIPQDTPEGTTFKRVGTKKEGNWDSSGDTTFAWQDFAPPLPPGGKITFDFVDREIWGETIVVRVVNEGTGDGNAENVIEAVIPKDTGRLVIDLADPALKVHGQKDLSKPIRRFNPVSGSGAFGVGPDLKKLPGRSLTRFELSYQPPAAVPAPVPAQQAPQAGRSDLWIGIAIGVGGILAVLALVGVGIWLGRRSASRRDGDWPSSDGSRPSGSRIAEVNRRLAQVSTIDDPVQREAGLKEQRRFIAQIRRELVKEGTFEDANQALFQARTDFARLKEMLALIKKGKPVVLREPSSIRPDVDLLDEALLRQAIRHALRTGILGKTKVWTYMRNNWGPDSDRIYVETLKPALDRAAGNIEPRLVMEPAGLHEHDLVASVHTFREMVNEDGEKTGQRRHYILDGGDKSRPFLLSVLFGPMGLYQVLDRTAWEYVLETELVVAMQMPRRDWVFYSSSDYASYYGYATYGRTKRPLSRMPDDADMLIFVENPKDAEVKNYRAFNSQIRGKTKDQLTARIKQKKDAKDADAAEFEATVEFLRYWSTKGVVEKYPDGTVRGLYEKPSEKDANYDKLISIFDRGVPGMNIATTAFHERTLAEMVKAFDGPDARSEYSKGEKSLLDTVAFGMYQTLLTAPALTEEEWLKLWVPQNRDATNRPKEGQTIEQANPNLDWEAFKADGRKLRRIAAGFMKSKRTYVVEMSPSGDQGDLGEVDTMLDHAYRRSHTDVGRRLRGRVLTGLTSSDSLVAEGVKVSGTLTVDVRSAVEGDVEVKGKLAVENSSIRGSVIVEESAVVTIQNSEVDVPAGYTLVFEKPKGDDAKKAQKDERFAMTLVQNSRLAGGKIGPRSVVAGYDSVMEDAITAKGEVVVALQFQDGSFEIHRYPSNKIASKAELAEKRFGGNTEDFKSVRGPAGGTKIKLPGQSGSRLSQLLSSIRTKVNQALTRAGYRSAMKELQEELRSMPQDSNQRTEAIRRFVDKLLTDVDLLNIPGGHEVVIDFIRQEARKAIRDITLQKDIVRLIAQAYRRDLRTHAVSVEGKNVDFSALRDAELTGDYTFENKTGKVVVLKMEDFPEEYVDDGVLKLHNATITITEKDGAISVQVRDRFRSGENPYSRQVYDASKDTLPNVFWSVTVVLDGRSGASVSEIASAAGISVNRATPVLEDLIKLGLVARDEAGQYVMAVSGLSDAAISQVLEVFAQSDPVFLTSKRPKAYAMDAVQPFIDDILNPTALQKELELDVEIDAMLTAAGPDAFTPGVLRKVFFHLTGNDAEVIARGRQRMNAGGAHTDWMFRAFVGFSINNSTYAVVRKKDDPADESLNIFVYGQNMELKRRRHTVLPSRRGIALKKGHPENWANYVIGVIQALKERGVKIPGMDIFITGDALQGKGLSSSAAIENAVILAILEATGEKLSEDPEENDKKIIEAGNWAENNVVNVTSGQLDQGASLKPGFAVFEFELAGSKPKGELAITSVEMPAREAGVKAISFDTGSDLPLAATDTEQRDSIENPPVYLEGVKIFNRRSTLHAIGQLLMTTEPVNNGQPFPLKQPGTYLVEDDPDTVAAARPNVSTRMVLYEAKYDFSAEIGNPEDRTMNPLGKDMPQDVLRAEPSRKVEYVKGIIAAAKGEFIPADQVQTAPPDQRIPIVLKDEFNQRESQAGAPKRSDELARFHMVGWVTQETAQQLVSAGVLSEGDISSTELPLDLYQYSANEHARVVHIKRLLGGEIYDKTADAARDRAAVAKMIRHHAQRYNEPRRDFKFRYAFENHIAAKLEKGEKLNATQAVYVVGALGDLSWDDKMQYFHGDSYYRPMGIAQEIIEELEAPSKDGSAAAAVNFDDPNINRDPRFESEFRRVGTMGLGAGWRGAHGIWLVEGKDGVNVDMLKGLTLGKNAKGEPLSTAQIKRLFEKQIGKTVPAGFLPYVRREDLIPNAQNPKRPLEAPEKAAIDVMDPMDGSKVIWSAAAGARIVTSGGAEPLALRDNRALQARLAKITGSRLAEDVRKGLAQLKASTGETQEQIGFRRDAAQNLSNLSFQVLRMAPAERKQLAEEALPILMAAIGTDDFIRSFLIDAIGGFGPEVEAIDPRAVDLLLEALGGSGETFIAYDEVAHQRAIRALGWIESQREDVIAALNEALKDEALVPPDVARARAAEALQKIAPSSRDVVVSLIYALKYENIFAHKNARKALAQIGKRDPGLAIPLLIEELKHSYERIKSSSVDLKKERATLSNRIIGLIEALGEIGPPAAKQSTPLFLTMLRDQKINALAEGSIRDRVHPEIVDAFGRMESEAAVMALSGAMGEPATLLRAIISLGQIGPAANRKEVVLKVMSKMKSKDPLVRLHAAITLGQLQTRQRPAILSLVEVGLKDADEKVRAAALNSLVTLSEGNPYVVDLLRRATTDPDEDALIRLSAVQAMGLIGPRPGVIGSLVPASADTDVRVRIAAASSLSLVGRTSDSDQIEFTLIGMLMDEDPSVRVAALNGLANLAGPRVSVAIPEVVKRLKDTNRDVRVAAAGTLGKIVPGADDKTAQKAIEALAEAVRTEADFEVLKALSDALVAIGPARVMPAVNNLTNEALQRLEFLRTSGISEEDALVAQALKFYRLLDATQSQLINLPGVLPVASPLNRIPSDLGRRLTDAADMFKILATYDVFVADVFNTARDDKSRSVLVNAMLDAIESNPRLRNGPLGYQAVHYLATYYLDLVFKRIGEERIRKPILKRVENMLYTRLMLRALNTEGEPVSFGDLVLSGWVTVRNQTGKAVKLTGPAVLEGNPEWARRAGTGRLHNVQITVFRDAEGKIRFRTQDISDPRLDENGNVKGVPHDSLGRVFDVLRRSEAPRTVIQIADAAGAAPENIAPVLTALESFGLAQQDTVRGRPVWSIISRSLEKKEDVPLPYGTVREHAEHIAALLSELVPKSYVKMDQADLMLVQRHLNHFPNFEVRAQGLYQVRDRRSEALPDVYYTAHDADGNLFISNIVYDTSFKKILWDLLVLLLDENQAFDTLNYKDPYSPVPGLNEIGGYFGPGLEEYYGIPGGGDFFGDPSHSLVVKNFHAILNNTDFSVDKETKAKIGMPGQDYHRTVMGSPTWQSTLKVVYLSRNVTNAPPGHPMHNPAKWDPNKTPEAILKRLIPHPYFGFDQETQKLLNDLLEKSDPDEKFEGADIKGALEKYAIPARTVLLYMVLNMIDKSLAASDIKIVPGSSYMLMRKHETSRPIRRRYLAAVTPERLAQMQKSRDEGGLGLTREEAQQVAGVAGQGVTTGGFVSVPERLVPSELKKRGLTMEETLLVNFGVRQPPINQLGRTGPIGSKGDWQVTMLSLMRHMPILPGIPKPSPASMDLDGDGLSDVGSAVYTGVVDNTRLLDPTQAHNDANSVGYLIDKEMARKLTYAGATFLINDYGVAGVETRERAMSPTKGRIFLQDFVAKPLRGLTMADVRNLLTYADLVRRIRRKVLYEIEITEDGTKETLTLAVHPAKKTITLNRLGPGDRPVQSKTLAMQREGEWEELGEHISWAVSYIGSQTDRYAVRQTELVTKLIAERVAAFRPAGARLISSVSDIADLLDRAGAITGVADEDASQVVHVTDTDGHRYELAHFKGSGLLVLSGMTPGASPAATVSGSTDPAGYQRIQVVLAGVTGSRVSLQATRDLAAKVAAAHDYRKAIGHMDQFVDDIYYKAANDADKITLVHAFLDALEANTNLMGYGDSAYRAINYLHQYYRVAWRLDPKTSGRDRLIRRIETFRKTALRLRSLRFEGPHTNLENAFLSGDVEIVNHTGGEIGLATGILASPEFREAHPDWSRHFVETLIDQAADELVRQEEEKTPPSDRWWRRPYDPNRRDLQETPEGHQEAAQRFLEQMKAGAWQRVDREFRANGTILGKKASSIENAVLVLQNKKIIIDQDTTGQVSVRVEDFRQSNNTHLEDAESAPANSLTGVFRTLCRLDVGRMIGPGVVQNRLDLLYAMGLAMKEGEGTTARYQINPRAREKANEILEVMGQFQISPEPTSWQVQEMQLHINSILDLKREVTRLVPVRERRRVPRLKGIVLDVDGHLMRSNITQDTGFGMTHALLVSGIPIAELLSFGSEAEKNLFFQFPYGLPEGEDLERDPSLTDVQYNYLNGEYRKLWDKQKIEGKLEKARAQVKQLQQKDYQRLKEKIRALSRGILFHDGVKGRPASESMSKLINASIDAGKNPRDILIDAASEENSFLLPGLNRSRVRELADSIQNPVSKIGLRSNNTLDPDTLGLDDWARIKGVLMVLEQVFLQSLEVVPAEEIEGSVDMIAELVKSGVQVGLGTGTFSSLVKSALREPLRRRGLTVESAFKLGVYGTEIEPPAGHPKDKGDNLVKILKEKEKKEGWKPENIGMAGDGVGDVRAPRDAADILNAENGYKDTIDDMVALAFLEEGLDNWKNLLKLREYADYALPSYRDPAVRQEMMRVLFPDFTTQGSPLESARLVPVGSRLISALMGALGHKDTRRLAIVALAELPDEELQAIRGLPPAALDAAFVHLSAALADSEPQVVRLDAARILGFMPGYGRRGLGPILKLLTGGTYADQAASAGLIGAMGPEAQDAVPQLTQVLTKLNRSAVQAATGRRKPGTQRVAGEYRVRLAVIRALARIGTAAETAGPALIDAATTEVSRKIKGGEQIHRLTDTEVQETAVRALVAIKPRALAEELTRFIDSPGIPELLAEFAAQDAAVAERIIRQASGSFNMSAEIGLAQALSRIGPAAAGAVPYLIEWMEAKDAGIYLTDEARDEIPYAVFRLKVHAAAAMAHVAPNHPGLIRRLLDLLKDKMGDNFTEPASPGPVIMEALGHLGRQSPELRAELAKELASETTYVQALAWKAVGLTTRTEAVAALSAVLVDPAFRDDYQSDVAAEMLGEMGVSAASANPNLIKALESKNGFTRSTTIKALGKTGRSDAGVAKVLISLLRTSSDPGDLSDAARALQSLNAATPEAAAVYRDMLREPSGDPRDAAAQAYSAVFMQIDAAAREERLRELLNTVEFMTGMENQYPRAGAAQALGRIGEALVAAGETPDPRILPRLRAALEDESAEVRQEAARGIGLMGPQAVQESVFDLLALLDYNANTPTQTIILSTTDGEEHAIQVPIGDELAFYTQTSREINDSYYVRQMAVQALGGIGRYDPIVTGVFVHTHSRLAGIASQASAEAAAAEKAHESRAYGQFTDAATAATELQKEIRQALANIWSAPKAGARIVESAPKTPESAAPAGGRLLSPEFKQRIQAFVVALSLLFPLSEGTALAVEVDPDQNVIARVTLQAGGNTALQISHLRNGRPTAEREVLPVGNLSAARALKAKTEAETLRGENATVDVEVRAEAQAMAREVNDAAGEVRRFFAPAQFRTDIDVDVTIAADVLDDIADRDVMERQALLLGSRINQITHTPDGRNIRFFVESKSPVLDEVIAGSRNPNLFNARVKKPDPRNVQVKISSDPAGVNEDGRVHVAIGKIDGNQIPNWTAAVYFGTNLARFAAGNNYAKDGVIDFSDDLARNLPAQFPEFLGRVTGQKQPSKVEVVAYAGGKSSDLFRRYALPALKAIVDSAIAAFDYMVRILGQAA